MSGTVHSFEVGSLGSLDVPRAVAGRLSAKTVVARSAWDNAAESFVRGYAMRRGAVGTEAFNTRDVFRDRIGQVHVRIGQSIAGLPVVGADLIVHADAKSGKVIGVNGRFAPDYDLPRQAEVNAGAAIEHAAAEYGIYESLVVGVPELTYIVDDRDSVRLAWTNLVSYRDSEGPQSDRIFADARTGAAIARHPQIHRAKNREIYDCDNTETLPGSLMFSEGQSSADAIAMAAYNGAGVAYNYFYNKHGRDSWNGSGGTIKASVHYGVDQGFAAWTGTQMFFGDGDGETVDALANSLDTVIHEFTHGVVGSSAGLGPTGESRALNESIADIFAAAGEAYSDNSVNADVWKMGDEVVLSEVAFPGGAFRHMDDPADGNHADYYPLRDNGTPTQFTPYINAGIQNLAFYLLVQGGSHPQGQTFHYVTAIGMTAAENIFYRALTCYATSSTNYRQMREATLQAATDLYGANSTQHTAVWNAWAAVGNHWLQENGTISSGGGESLRDGYTTTITAIHSGHLFGPGTADFNLHLQKWNGSAWVEVASQTTSSPNEVLEYSGTAGQYRWRIHASSGTGSYSLYSNRPK